MRCTNCQFSHMTGSSRCPKGSQICDFAKGENRFRLSLWQWLIRGVDRPRKSRTYKKAPLAQQLSAHSVSGYQSQTVKLSGDILPSRPDKTETGRTHLLVELFLGPSPADEFAKGCRRIVDGIRPGLEKLHQRDMSSKSLCPRRFLVSVPACC
ncbi:hypothetical protein EV356DRAFT_500660 [Viridothelium virens]|uniref:Uncharacterized protein n=1 Tax=Viridothelium virens TaxID=1048519 RepID=A0A6A6GSC5_VIRVR|nr:hypothetical protein EV356DRAFT_500660 [Viridothelium virens]